MSDSTVIVYQQIDDKKLKRKKPLVLPVNYNYDRAIRKEEAMFLFGSMSESTFDDYRKQGLIPQSRLIGSIPVWRMSDIQAAIKKIFDSEAGDP